MEKEERRMTCNIRKYVVTRYGEKAACLNSMDSWDECESKCKMASNCPQCGHQRILAYDSCFGRQQICLNPECGMDK